MSVGLAVAMPAPAAGAASPRLRTRAVVRGLDNPRGLAFLPSGMLAVAEAGHAGSLCLGQAGCGGLTGRIIVVSPKGGHRTTLATGFPSIGGPFAPFGLGGLVVRDGRLYAIVGENPQEFGDPTSDCQGRPRPNACAARLRRIIARVGNFVRVRSTTADRGSQVLARVGRFDYRYTSLHPQPQTPPDADPFGLIDRPSRGFYVIDAASNTLGSVDVRGRISVLGVVPDPPHHEPIYDAAPTCAAQEPDRSVIIATESGMLLRWKRHRISRLLDGGKIQQVVACLADAQGNVYLANLDTSVRHFIGRPHTGSVVRVSPEFRATYLARNLNYPTGMTMGPDGHLYVAVNGLCPAQLSQVNSQNAPPHACPGSGEVIRLATP
jgi:hypothetical protein